MSFQLNANWNHFPRVAQSRSRAGSRVFFTVLSGIPPLNVSADKKVFLRGLRIRKGVMYVKELLSQPVVRGFDSGGADMVAQIASKSLWGAKSKPPRYIAPMIGNAPIFSGQNSIDTQDHSSYTPIVKMQCLITS